MFFREVSYDPSRQLTVSDGVINTNYPFKWLRLLVRQPNSTSLLPPVSIPWCAVPRCATWVMALSTVSGLGVSFVHRCLQVLR